MLNNRLAVPAAALAGGLVATAAILAGAHLPTSTTPAPVSTPTATTTAPAPTGHQDRRAQQQPADHTASPRPAYRAPIADLTQVKATPGTRAATERPADRPATQRTPTKPRSTPAQHKPKTTPPTTKAKPSPPPSPEPKRPLCGSSNGFWKQVQKPDGTWYCPPDPNPPINNPNPEVINPPTEN